MSTRKLKIPRVACIAFPRHSTALNFNKAWSMELVHPTSCWGDASLGSMLAQLTVSYNASSGMGQGVPMDAWCSSGASRIQIHMGCFWILPENKSLQVIWCLFLDFLILLLSLLEHSRPWRCLGGLQPITCTELFCPHPGAGSGNAAENTYSLSQTYSLIGFLCPLRE